MVNKEEEVVDQNNQPIEQQTPIEKQIADRPKIEKQIFPKTTVKPTKIDFSFSNDTLANEDDMSQVRDILASGEEQSEALVLQESLYVSVEEVARFLQLAYDAQGFFTYKELWITDKAFIYEVAEGILPQINDWIQRVPFVGHAIKTGSAAGSWGRLLLDMGGRWILVYKRKQLESEQKQKEEGEQNHANKSTRSTNGIYVP